MMYKGQSKKHSFIEALINILVGYGIAVSAQMVIFPLFGIPHLPVSDHLAIGGFFTVVSICRSYMLRRLFNWLHIKGIL